MARVDAGAVTQHNELGELQVLCAKKIGNHPKECIYKMGMKLADFPTRIVEEIIPWISAYNLMDIDTSGLEERGLNTEQMWQKHAQQRWLHRKPSQRNPFLIGRITWRQFYIDEHFKETLNYCSRDYLKYRPPPGEDPKRTFKAALKDVASFRFQTPPDEYTEFSNVNDLRELVPHVRTMSITFRQLHYLEQYPDFLHALSHSIETLSLQNLSTRGSLSILRTLLVYGRKLKYLDVMNCIWDDIMMSMMTMMSGQMSAVEMAKLDADMCEEARKVEKEVCQSCPNCQLRRRTYQPYQVPNFSIENSTIHPVSDVKFVRILRGWSDLQEFVHMCCPLSTPKVEQETIAPLLDAIVYLAKTKQLTRIHLNGPYHMSVINFFTIVSSGNVAPVNDITYNTLIHCHIGCQLGPKETNGIRRTRSPSKRVSRGIFSLDMNSVHCDVVLRPVLFKPIVDIVATDEVLRHLSIQSCRQFPDNLSLLFRAITKANRLVTLDITGNYVQRSAFGDLITVIKKCHSLRSLVVDYCELPTRESYVEELAEAVARSNLSTVSVANNRLGEYAAQLVVNIVKVRNGDKTGIHSLNVSQNCIKYEAITAMCDQLLILGSARETSNNGPLITNLSLDDILECDMDNLTEKLAQLSRLKVVGNVISRNNLLQASRASMMGYVAQM